MAHTSPPKVLVWVPLKHMSLPTHTASYHRRLYS